MPSVAVTVELAAVAAVVAPTVTLLLAPPFRRAAPGLALVGSVALAGWLVLAVVLAAVAPSLLLVVAVVTVVGASVWWLYTHPETHVRGLPPGTLGLRESNRALGERRRYLELAERLGPVFRTMQFGHRVACVAGLERTHRTLDRCSASLATASLPFTRDVTGGFLRYMDAGAHERYGPLFRRALARPVVAAAEDDVRAIVAWAFDRVAPAPIAKISEKYHTPITAITVTTIVNLIFMALFVFTPWFSKIVILIEAALSFIGIGAVRSEAASVPLSARRGGFRAFDCELCTALLVPLLRRRLHRHPCVGR